MKTSARFNQNVSEGNQSPKILLNGPRAYVDYVCYGIWPARWRTS